MKNIDGMNYYTLREVLSIIEERTGIKMEINNTSRQFFYRLSLPKIGVKQGRHYWYREDGVNELVEYLFGKNRARELASELAKLRKANYLFIKKYRRRKEERGRRQ